MAAVRVKLLFRGVQPWSDRVICRFGDSGVCTHFCAAWNRVLEAGLPFDTACPVSVHAFVPHGIVFSKPRHACCVERQAGLTRVRIRLSLVINLRETRYSNESLRYLC